MGHSFLKKAWPSSDNFLGSFRTLPISEVHDTTIVLGTVVDNLTRDVMLIGRLGLFGSTPFLVGGRYPFDWRNRRQSADNHVQSFSCCWWALRPTVKILNWCGYLCVSVSLELRGHYAGRLHRLTGRVHGLPFTFTHRFGGKWSSCGQLVSERQNLKSYH